RHSPSRTRRRGPYRARYLACTHDPAVQVRVAPVSASAATAVGAWRTVTTAYGTYASPAKKQQVSRPRLRIVAVSPGRAVMFLGGVSRRSDTASSTAPPTAPGTATSRAPESRQASAVPAPA